MIVGSLEPADAGSGQLWRPQQGPDPARRRLHSVAGRRARPGRSPLRQSRQVPALLVLAHHVDATDVPLLVGESRRDEGLDELRRLVLRVHARADADDVRVVVLAAQAGGFLAPGQGGADAVDFVGGDRLAVAGAADDDAQGVGVGGHLAGGQHHVGRVVVLGVVGVGAAVDGFVPGGGQPGGEMVLQFVAGVVAAVAAARSAARAWGAGDKAQRLAPLGRLVAGLAAAQEEIAETVTAELGCPIGFATSVQAALPLGVANNYLGILAGYEFEER